MDSLKDISFREDSLLFTLLQQDDEVAFNRIYNKYYAMVYQFAVGYLKDDDMSQDIVQQVFLQLWESKKKITLQHNLQNDLYSMAKHCVLQTLREKNKEVEIAYDLKYFGSSDTNVAAMEKKKDVLYEAIERLPKQKKIICMMKLADELNNEEIAARLGISVSTIKAHYNQALRFIHLYLTKKNVVWILLLKLITINMK